jgi:hypothetical protein
MPGSARTSSQKLREGPPSGDSIRAELIQLILGLSRKLGCYPWILKCYVEEINWLCRWHKITRKSRKHCAVQSAGEEDSYSRICFTGRGWSWNAHNAQT